MSLKSSDIKVMTIILVELRDKKSNNWEVPVSGISDKWKKVNIPFHYFQLPENPVAQIDLSKISKILFLVDPKSSGTIAIDNIEFYQ